MFSFDQPSFYGCHEIENGIPTIIGRVRLDRPEGNILFVSFSLIYFFIKYIRNNEYKGNGFIKDSGQFQ